MSEASDKIIKQTNDMPNYEALVSDIGLLMTKARSALVREINSQLVQTYWKIGERIVLFEQKGNNKAQYGSALLRRLSHDLTLHYGKGFSLSNVTKMRKFYLAFPTLQTVSAKLSWSHYVELLKSDDNLEITFYTKECEAGGWSVRELKRQMDSMLFHRIALSKDKEGIIELSRKGAEVVKAEDLAHDPYVLEFIDLPQLPQYKESDIEEAIANNLSRFMLELGRGFAFVGRQYRITLGGRHLYVDLLFYNVILKCYVLIDLKRNEVQHEDIGQMNLYLNYFKNEVCTDGDNEPVGIVIGAKHDQLTMQYALEGISNQLFVSRYQFYLPQREELERELRLIIENKQLNTN